MDSDIDLPFLMARYKEGDSTAATAPVDPVSPHLHRFCLMQCVSRRHADDLLQETWLRIHEVRHTYRPGQPVLPWLYAIARHIRGDHYRKAVRTEGREDRLTESTVFPDEPSKPQAHAPDLVELLAVLPESQREVIAMLKLAH